MDDRDALMAENRRNTVVQKNGASVVRDDADIEKMQLAGNEKGGRQHRSTID